MTASRMTVVPNTHKTIELCEFGLDDDNRISTYRSVILAWCIEVMLTGDGTEVVEVTPITPEALPHVWCLWYADGRYVFPMDVVVTSLVEAEQHAHALLMADQARRKQNADALRALRTIRRGES